MKKNRILAVALVICLIAILAFGSLAYFTESKTITNQFKTATSDDPNQLLFDIDLYETDINGGNTPVSGNTYSNILPGKEMTKDPTVKNTGLYDQYVRLLVTVSKADAWAAACQKHSITGVDATFGDLSSDWTLKEMTKNLDDTITYTYYLNSKLEPGETSTLFEKVTIPAEFDNDDMATLKEFTITIVAQAIQSDNLGDDPVAAFGYWED